MREIKCRGKITDIDKWVFGDAVRHYENQRRFILCDQMAYEFTTYGINRLVSEYYFEVIPETIGQYTGLKDKNGVEIYEGDVVKAENTQNVGEIKYVYEHGAFLVYSRDENGAYYEYLDAGLCQKYFEVVGNIHDNPELLDS